MAIPLIAGLPWLAGILGGLFASLVAWFASFMTKRLAITAAAVVSILAVTATFYAALEALLSGIVASAPPHFGQAVGLVWPSNASACLAAILSAYVLRWVYDWQVKIIQLKLF